MSKQEEEEEANGSLHYAPISPTSYSPSSYSFLSKQKGYPPSYAPSPTYDPRHLESKGDKVAYSPSARPLESKGYVPSPTYDGSCSPELLDPNCCIITSSSFYLPSSATTSKGYASPSFDANCFKLPYAPSLENYEPFPKEYKPPLPCWPRDKYSILDYESYIYQMIDSFIDLLVQAGLHGYNLHKGTNLQFVDAGGYDETALGCFRMVLQAEDPISNSTCKFETGICYRIGSLNDSLLVHVLECRLHPPEVNSCNYYERCVVDAFFKGDLPDWVLNESNMMEESEVEENKDWLHFYCKLALFAKIRFCWGIPKPLELRKVVVQTKEDVESKQKVKAWNAIFYVSFKSSDGQDYNAIVQRTTKSTPGIISLEVKCLK